MSTNPSFILCLIALVLAVCSFIWNGYPLLGVAVILIAIAAILPGPR